MKVTSPLKKKHAVDPVVKGEFLDLIMWFSECQPTICEIQLHDSSPWLVLDALGSSIWLEQLIRLKYIDSAPVPMAARS